MSVELLLPQHYLLACRSIFVRQRRAQFLTSHESVPGSCFFHLASLAFGFSTFLVLSLSARRARPPAGPRLCISFSVRHNQMPAFFSRLGDLSVSLLCATSGAPLVVLRTLIFFRPFLQVLLPTLSFCPLTVCGVPDSRTLPRAATVDSPPLQLSNRGYRVTLRVHNGLPLLGPQKFLASVLTFTRIPSF